MILDFYADLGHNRPVSYIYIYFFAFPFPVSYLFAAVVSSLLSVQTFLGKPQPNGKSLSWSRQTGKKEIFLSIFILTADSGLVFSGLSFRVRCNG